MAITYESPYGKIAVSAHKTETGYEYAVTVPANTHAILSFEEGVEITAQNGTKTVCPTDETTCVGSGTYKIVTV